MFKYFRFSCLFLITAYPCLTHAEISKTTIYQFSERKFGNTEVPVEITWPTSGKKPYPVIISQHGSERDGKTFIGGIGKTDEYTKRLIRKAPVRGYAVFAIDAFYKRVFGMTYAEKKQQEELEYFIYENGEKKEVRKSKLNKLKLTADKINKNILITDQA